MPLPQPQTIPQATLTTYSLPTILTRASTHPIYEPIITDPNHAASGELSLQSFPLLTKDHLIRTFNHLKQTDPTFLHSTYISPTGGTRSAAHNHLYFFTSVAENQVQRALAATILHKINVLASTDIVINLHGGAAMYRCQDLTGTLLDHCGATDLSVGSNASDEDVATIGRTFSANTVMAPSSRLLQFARYMYGVKKATGGWGGMALKKAVFTSVPLTAAHERYLQEALGVDVVASVYGSAEAGPWGGMVPQRIGADADHQPGPTKGREFIFDRRQMVVELVDDQGMVLADSINLPAAAGRGGPPIQGEIVLTSLTRFRNPLVRYRCGDYASLSSISVLPPAQVKDILTRDPDATENLARIIMYGRSPDTSFFLDSDYIDIRELDRRVFADPQWEVLEWQVIIYPLSDEELAAGQKKLDGLEFRVVRKSTEEMTEGYLAGLRSAIVEKVVSEGVRVVVKVVGYDGMEKGRMAEKILKIIDRRA